MAPRRCLPGDVLLNVFLWLDARSIVRCAAVSKHWRRAVIDNAPQLRRQADRFLLLGFHYRETYPGRLHFCPRSTWLPSSAGQQYWSDDLPVPAFAPVASSDDKPEERHAVLSCCDGLLLVCRAITREVSVYNPLTRFHATMPRYDQLFTDTYVLHSVHDPKPNSFQVLTVWIGYDGDMALQNYVSETGSWGKVIRPLPNDLLMPCKSKSSCGAPVVICQGALHWLCGKASKDRKRCALGEHDLVTHTVAVDIATGNAWMTRLPEQCSMRTDKVSEYRMLMLATAEDGRLALLRGEEGSHEVSMWVFVGVGDDGRRSKGNDDETNWVLLWSVNIRKLIEDAGLAHFRLECKYWEVLEVRLECFCPRSRHVIIWVPYLGLFVLDLESIKIQRAAGDNQTHIWPCEMDLTICYSSLKRFC